MPRSLATGECLGRGLTISPTPEVSLHEDLTQYSSTKLGWDIAVRDVSHTREAYLACVMALIVHFQMPSAPPVPAPA